MGNKFTKMIAYIVSWVSVLVWAEMKFDCVRKQTWSYYLIPWIIFMIALSYLVLSEEKSSD